MIPTDQEFVQEIDLPEYATKAFVVIDKSVWGSSWGGLRVVPDPSMEETKAAARTMTLKYGFIGLPIGGAKAALGLPPALEPVRAQILKKFGEAIAPILRTKRWLPGLDMGSSIPDLMNLHLGAGIDLDVSAWRNQSAIHTAWSVFIATQSALAVRGETLQDKTFVIQGFGRVGTELARLFAEAGAHLLGFATRVGACFVKDGINLNQALLLLEQAGDRAPLQFPPGAQLESALLLEQEADIAVPCARAWAIHKDNWQNLKATIIPCAANAAIDIDTEEKLYQDGKTVIPDFIANCGGVFASYVDRYLRPPDIRSILERSYRKEIEKLLYRSSREHTNLSKIATPGAMARIHNLDASRRRARYDLAKQILPFIPDLIRQPFLRDYCSRSYFHDLPHIASA